MVRISTELPNFTGRMVQGRYHLREVLGSGAYGVVHRAFDTEAGPLDPTQYAVKCLRNSDTRSDKKRASHHREGAMHKLITSHENILSLHLVIYEGDFVFIVLDLIDGGDLFGSIVNDRAFWRQDELVRRVALQICDGLQHAHSMGVAHRDLKPENILCSKDGQKVVIADFGLATREIQVHDFGCGSAFYMSPECIGEENDYEPYCPLQSDVWSLGIILVNLVTGRNPWHQARSDDQCFSAYLLDQAVGRWNGHFLREMLPISHSLNSLLTRILVVDPADRPTIDEIKDEIRRIDTFFMTPEDIAVGTQHVQMTASFYASPPTDEAPAVEDAPEEDEDVVDQEAHEAYDDSWDSRAAAAEASVHNVVLNGLAALPTRSRVPASISPSSSSSASSRGPITPRPSVLVSSAELDMVDSAHADEVDPVRPMGLPESMFDKVASQGRLRAGNGAGGGIGLAKRRNSSISDVFKIALRRLRVRA